MKLAKLAIYMLLMWKWSGPVTAIGHVWRYSRLEGKYIEIANPVLSNKVFVDSTVQPLINYCYEVCYNGDCTLQVCAVSK